MTFTRIRFLLLILAMGGAAVFLMVRWIRDVPAFDDLATHSGAVASVERVERRTRYGHHEDLEVRLVGRFIPMTYLDWFPRFEQVEASIAPGLELTVRYGENDWLWHAEANGVVLVDYAHTAAAVRANSRVDPLISMALLACFVWGMWRLWTTREIRPRSASAKRPFELDDEAAWEMAFDDPDLADLFRIALDDAIEELLGDSPSLDAVYEDGDRCVTVRGEFLRVGGLPADAVVVSGAARDAPRGFVVAQSYFVHRDGADVGFDILSAPRLIGTCGNHPK
jgi:hypothetical protein